MSDDELLKTGFGAVASAAILSPFLFFLDGFATLWVLIPIAILFAISCGCSLILAWRA